MTDTREDILNAALEATFNVNRAGINIGTGVGKTRIGLEHMARNYNVFKKYLVVIPEKSIIKSWQDECKKIDKLYLLNHITFVTYRSLIKESYDYDVIYLDECHSLKAIHNKWLKAYIVNGGITFGLTGTYPKHKGTEKKIMCDYYCQLLFDYKVDEAIENEIINDYHITIHKIQLSKTYDIVITSPNGKDFKTSEEASYKYWCDKIESCENDNQLQDLRLKRMYAMMKFKTKESYAELLLRDMPNKCLAFVNTKEQADKICLHSHHSGNANSAKNLEDFKSGVITKLTAIEQLSQGVNIPNLKSGIIMHSFGNNRKLAQKIGRFLRLMVNEIGDIHILCYENTVDVEWIKESLKDFDQSKIEWITPRYYKNIDY